MGHLHRLYTKHAAEVWRRESAILATQGLVRPPVAVQWIVTSACDLSCPHCYSGAGRRHPDELTTEQAKHGIIDELAAMDPAPTLVLAGGELLLRRDIPELVAYASERGVPWAMHTHGGHVPKHLEWLTRTPPRLAAISLDGEAEAHDGFRGKAGSHAAALTAVRMLRDLGCPEVVIGTTITRRNADSIADLFATVRSSGAHSWGLHLFAPEGRGADHLALFPTDGQLQRVVAFAKRARQSFHVELCNEWGGADADDVYVRDDPFACGAGRISCVIGAQGDLLPCTTTDLRESEGNVREFGLRELWLAGFSRFRRHGHDHSDACGDDQECWLQSRNGNACRHRAFDSPTPHLGREVGETAIASPDVVVRLRLPVAHVDAPRMRLSSPSALASARAMALASLLAPACTTPATVDPVSSSDAPSSEPAKLPATPATPEVPIELSEWPAQLDGEGLVQRYRQVELADQLDLLAPVELATIDALDQSLAELEAARMFHPNVVAEFWARIGRRLADSPLSKTERDALVGLSARLHRHARVVDALLRAEAVTGPVEFHAWRSKAAPPAGYRGGVTLPEGLLEAARELWPSVGAGTWETEACIDVEVREGAAWRVRAGERKPLVVGEPIAVCRLDLIVVAPEAKLADCCLGSLQLDPDVHISPWEFESALTTQAKTALDQTIADALDGSEPALAPLAGQLPQSQAAIRRAVEAKPDAPGAAALRQLLWSWDR